MGMPKKLFMFDTYINGQTYLGLIEEITPPKLSLKTEDYQGAGMPGSVAVLMGFDSSALDMELTMGGLEVSLLKTLGGPIDSLQLRFAGSYTDDASGQAVACEIQTRGRFTELDWGAAKAGENTQHKYTLKNTYCRIAIEREDVLEVDMINMIWKVGGKDLLESHRANIGH
ncbi:phage major tail tube protein [Sodalis sp.]|uniref:phage major tail tube protein n=1 Tax=Sodalis sp. (in: enterobacteria) TaxID=1898979 RepID=UPI003873B8C6